MERERRCRMPMPVNEQISAKHIDTNAPSLQPLRASLDSRLISTQCRRFSAPWHSDLRTAESLSLEDTFCSGQQELVWWQSSHVSKQE